MATNTMIDAPLTKPELIQKLRQATGAGMMECHNAYDLRDGDWDCMVEYILRHNIAICTSEAGRYPQWTARQKARQEAQQVEKQTLIKRVEALENTARILKAAYDRSTHASET